MFQKSLCAIFLAPISLLLTACEAQKISVEEKNVVTEEVNQKTELTWFNLFLPPQTLYDLKPEFLGLDGSFLSYEIKGEFDQNVLDIQFLPDAIRFYYPKFSSDTKTIHLVLKLTEQQTVDVKVKMFDTKSLTVTGGEGRSDPNTLILNGIDPKTSVWNNSDIEISWTHQDKFDPEYSGVLIYHAAGRYDSAVEYKSITKSLHYDPDTNKWTINQEIFAKLIRDIPVDDLLLSINLISNDSHLAEVFDVAFYKVGIQKRHLIPD